MAKGKAYSSGKNTSTNRLADLQEQLAKVTPQSKEWDKLNAAIEKINSNLEKSVANIDDFSDGVKSLGAYVGKSNKLFQAMNTLSDGMSTSMDSIAQTMQAMPADASKFKKQVVKTADAYKSLGTAIAVSVKKLKKQQITQSQYNQSVLDGYEDLEEQIDRLDSQMEGLSGTSLAMAKDMKSAFEMQKDSLEAFAKAAEKSKKNIEGMGFAMDTLSSTGIPAMDKLGDVIMKAKEGGMGLTLAFAALGAALGKIAYDTGLFGDKLKTIAGYDKKLAGIASKIEVINQKIALGMTGGPNFIAKGAGIDFGATMAQMAIEFESASKTALFGDKLGGVGYGAAQLQIAGIAAENIATAMKDAASAMGSNVSGKFGADMAILAARTGQTSEGIASISDTFMRLDGVSKEVSLNMQEGLRTMAKQANVNLGALMEDVAAASKDALSYQIKSGPALAKAATFAQSLGTKFVDIANAGKSMVLNYKDSIKAEMSLSAMLGKRVDLSQVRALFAAGRTEDAVKALKAQGLDPSKMNMFQQEALKNATGGLDLNSLQKIATRTGRTGGELGQESVSVGNNKFLMTKEAAESAKAIGSAVASAMAELAKQEKITGPLEMAKQEAIKQNTLGIKDLMYEQKKVEMWKEVQTGIEAAIPMLIGALALGYLGPKLLRGLAGKGGGSGMMSMFRGGGGGGVPNGNTGRYIMSNKGKMIHEFNPSGAANPRFSMAKNLGHNPVQEYNLGRNITSNNGKLIHEFTPSGKINPRFSMAQNLGTKGINGSNMAFAETAATRGLGTSTAISSAEGLASGTSKASRLAKIGGKGLGAAGLVLDAGMRLNSGQSITQTAAGVGGGMAGAWAGGEAGAAIGASIGAAFGGVGAIPGAVIGGLIGSIGGYMAGGSLADSLTGANEEVVTAQGATTVATENMTAEQLAQGVDQGTLLSDTAYGLELQQKMLEVMGLQAEILYDIASEQRAVTSVNLDGAKVLSLLNSRSNKAYGVARDTMPSTVLAKRG